MASFTVRVELRGAKPSDYDDLHRYMGKEGFHRAIASSDGGTVYQLPTAEYSLIGSYTKSEALDKAKRAAELAGDDPWILVTESKGRTWSGLPEVKAKSRS